jgi:NADP-dependent 3-hydroxy acid dehydrogenase YdfG
MKRAIIIGASSGMGYQLAKKFAVSGYLVGVTGRRLPLLQELQTSMPMQIFPMEMDVRNFSSVENHLI